MTFWESVKRWYKITFKGYVILREYGHYDGTEDEFKGLSHQPYDCWMKVSLIKKSELPAIAVHCTGESHSYSIDYAHVRYDEHDQGFKAHHGHLYLIYNGFDEALSKRWTDFDHVNIKKVAIILGIVLAVAVVMFIIR